MDDRQGDPSGETKVICIPCGPEDSNRGHITLSLWYVRGYIYNERGANNTGHYGPCVWYTR